MTIWIYVDPSKQVGEVDHLRVVASEDAANADLRSAAWEWRPHHHGNETPCRAAHRTISLNVFSRLLATAE
jgi:hypothetical protein